MTGSRGRPSLPSTRPPVVGIFGPTASGKTAVAEAVADMSGGEVVSADSMQAYRGLPILTAAPARPTRLVGIWSLDREGSVAEYARLAHEAIDELLATGRMPVVAGGTGLYLRAALADLQIPPASSPASRQRWERVYERLGPEQAHSLLAERDPAGAQHIHPNDRKRVVRALELAELGESLRPSEDRLWAAETRRPTLVFGLEISREALAARIERRAQLMLAAGAQDEARRALEHGISSTAVQALGLREVAELPPEQAVAALTRRTLRLTAYQRKWMRRIPDLVLMDADRPAVDVAAEILRQLDERLGVGAREAGRS